MGMITVGVDGFWYEIDTKIDSRRLLAVEIKVAGYVGRPDIV